MRERRARATCSCGATSESDDCRPSSILADPQMAWNVLYSPSRGSISLGNCSGAATIASSRSEEHTSELQSLMRISYAVFCLKKKHRLQHPTLQMQPHTHHAIKQPISHF